MRRTLAVTALLLLAVFIAACGSSESGSETTGTSTATTSAGGGDAAYLEENAALVERYLSEKGTFLPPPERSPRPQAGKHIALVSCGQTVIPSCGLEINAAREAAEALGWRTTLIDAANGDPVSTGPGIQNAVAQRVDGIFTYYVDCEYIREPLQAARDAGIPVVNSNGRDCDQSDSAAPSLFTYTIRYNAGDGSFQEWVDEVSIAQARYAIDKLDGEAHIGFATDSTSAASVAVGRTVEAAVKECGGCSIELLLFPIGDIGTRLQGKAESFLLKNADVNTVIPAYSAIMQGGLIGAIQTARRDLLVSVGEGLPEGIALIRDGKAQYGYGLSYGWEGYAAIDSLNRILNEEDPDVNSGIGVKLFDEEHDFPSGDDWVPPYDYQALYRKAWGVDQ
ncbi:substrate-binding domain-containing protein [Conexibacter stalactiti]|uniref:Substrate-binding domain-containing protein n=1 Tax=Conexibacter stalactiti TaxID=1940611 RepID=A0ABU4HZY4_9ACTN|nr:substrate-binding domain-containing protein [Conexibacter stalactiti]MDW5597634.1 substrate-binding domain-containing protein [Conexibacter stalactiti]MEC5038276.1 substrate-binding domain-containing protein [Conexibacter stalactiti]